MKRAENIALAALIGLLVIASILLGGAITYKSVSLWAGMMAAAGQAIVAGLAWWGLLLARQQDELRELPSLGSTSPRAGGVADSNFRMSFGNESQTTPTAKAEVRSLETGFQRTVVGLTSALLLILACVISYLVWLNFDWAKSHPDKPFPIAGGDRAFDELTLVIGLGSAIIYGILWSASRVRRSTVGYGEAISSNFIVGMPGMIALGVAVVVGYLKIGYAQELAAIVIAAMLLLQGLELAVNAVRSYSSVEEVDQDPIDLQSLPLVPMLSSVWLSGLKMLFALSFGLSREKNSSVIGRLMPRTLLAILAIAVFMSCVQVVQPGEVAVLERLGQAQGYPDLKAMDAALLHPGIHLTLPWPIDTLVRIPTGRLQSITVGSELHALPGLSDKTDFRFWTFRPNNAPEGEEEAEFITGDPNSQQILETFVGIWWRVREPAKFYNSLSHSEFFEKGAGDTKNALPIYEAIIQQSASYAVTKTFAIHTLDKIMTSDLIEVTRHCREILQDKLDEADSGLEIVDLSIKDVHPPIGVGEVDDPNEQPDHKRRGPAHAYEYVVSAREIRESLINMAKADNIRMVNEAKASASNEIGAAQSYRLDQIAKAQGDAARLTEMLQGLQDQDAVTREYLIGLARQQKLYQALRDVLPQVNKVVVDPHVLPPQIWQGGEKGLGVPGR